MPVTTKQLIDTVRELADKNPDFVYTRGVDETCQYTPTEGNPQGCIIGAAMTRHGLPIPPNVDPTPSARTYLTQLRNKKLLQTDNNLETTWLNQVQTLQDNQNPWKQAIQKADKLHPLP